MFAVAVASVLVVDEVPLLERPVVRGVEVVQLLREVMDARRRYRLHLIIVIIVILAIIVILVIIVII